MSNQQDLTMLAGENITLTMYARDPSNNVQDLTGQNIVWNVGINIVADVVQPVISTIGTALVATAGSFTVTLEGADTMPLSGNYLHQAIITTDGSLEWVNNSNQEIVFQTDDGTDILWVNDFDGDQLIVTDGTLHIRRTVLG